MDLRKAIDITPWDKSGGSFFGLTRGQAKTLALALIVLAVLMMVPPFIPSPDDVINIALSKWMVERYGTSPENTLIITYTIIPWTIFLLGVWIYPYNTRGLINGYINKLQRLIKKHMGNPASLAVMIIVGFYVFKLYAGWIT